MNEQPLTVIFIGIQGSGKGTQADLLEEYLKKETEEERLIHFETGDHLRSFMKKDGYTNEKVKRSINAGNIQPVFLPAYFWSDALINQLDENTHLIMDGSPRPKLEAEVLDGAMEFYGREPYVINLEISEETGIDRLLKRGREDDTRESIKKRIKWSKDEVTPSIDFMREHDRYTVLDIDGERSIETIQEDIRNQIGV